MFGIGNQELIIVLVVVLIIFGPKNLPKLANSIGRAVRDFKSGLSGMDKELRDSIEADEKPVDTPAQVEKTPTSSTDEKRD